VGVRLGDCYLFITPVGVVRLLDPLRDPLLLDDARRSEAWRVARVGEPACRALRSQQRRPGLTAAWQPLLGAVGGSAARPECVAQPGAKGGAAPSSQGSERWHCQDGALIQRAAEHQVEMVRAQIEHQRDLRAIGTDVLHHGSIGAAAWRVDSLA